MIISQNQVKGLARLLQENSDIPYMKALDCVAERLTGHKWNILLSKFQSMEPNKKCSGPFLLNEQNADDYDKICQALVEDAKNVTDISPGTWTLSEQRIIRDIEGALGLSLRPIVLRWLLTRPSPKQPPAYTQTIIEGKPFEVQRCMPEIFGDINFSCHADDEMRDARRCVFLEHPLVIMDLVDTYERKKRQEKYRVDLLTTELVCIDMAISKKIDDDLLCIGYSNRAIQTLKDKRILPFLGDKTISIPPPVVLNQICLNKDNLYTRVATACLVSPDSMNKVLMSLRTPNGMERTIDWSLVERGIQIIQHNTTFEAKFGDFASDYYYQWSILERLNSGKCIKRFVSLPDTATRLAQNAQDFVFETIQDIEDLGRT